MQYMLLIYGDESAGVDMSADEEAASMQAWTAYTAWLRDQGWMQGGDPLQPVAQSTTVRVREGERLITDGPFAETKETLGGYYLLEVDDLDQAIEAAGRCPGAATGTVELRPVMEFGGAPEA
jgi:hypothetical protein